MVKKSPPLHGQKSAPTSKFLSTAEAYFVIHIGLNFQISLIYDFIIIMDKSFTNSFFFVSTVTIFYLLQTVLAMAIYGLDWENIFWRILFKRNYSFEPMLSRYWEMVRYWEENICKQIEVTICFVVNIPS